MSCNDVTSNNLDFFENESGINGGALYVYECQRFKIETLKVLKNKATNLGGGVFISGSNDVSLKQGEISYNTCVEQDGGGIYINNKCLNVKFENLKIHKNTAN